MAGDPHHRLDSHIEDLVRDVPDFPSPGIVFKDITPLLADPVAMVAAVNTMAEPWRESELDLVVGIEARGFIFGALVAVALGVGFVPARKPGKLPGETISESYGLEYGHDSIEIHADALPPGSRTLVVDDVLATGGTAAAAAKLVEGCSSEVVGFGFLIELAFLNGRSMLGSSPISAAITYGANEDLG